MKTINPYLKAWKGTMTNRERFLKQMTFQPFDRCVNMEFGYWDECFIKWSIFLENEITSNEEADRFFNFDRIEGVWPNNWMLPPFEERVLSETETTKIMINRDGLTAEVAKGWDSIPHFMSATIVTPEDWKRCKEERFCIDDPSRVPDPVQVKLQHPDDRDYPLGIDCGSMIGKVRDMLTFEGLAYACYDYPDMVEDMVRPDRA